MTHEADFFRSRLDQRIDLRHPLAVLASRMPWREIEASIAHAFATKGRAGKKIEDGDFFGTVDGVVCGGVLPPGPSPDAAAADDLAPVFEARSQ